MSMRRTYICCSCNAAVSPTVKFCPKCGTERPQVLTSMRFRQSAWKFTVKTAKKLLYRFLKLLAVAVAVIVILGAFAAGGIWLHDRLCESSYLSRKAKSALVCSIRPLLWGRIMHRDAIVPTARVDATFMTLMLRKVHSAAGNENLREVHR